jgi:hypothetical protein
VKTPTSADEKQPLEPIEPIEPFEQNAPTLTLKPLNQRSVLNLFPNFNNK